METDLNMNGHHLLNTNFYATNIWQCYFSTDQSLYFNSGQLVSPQISSGFIFKKLSFKCHLIFRLEIT